MVTTQDGKFPLNQLGQISMKSPQIIMVNMSGFPEVRPSLTHTHKCTQGQVTESLTNEEKPSVELRLIGGEGGGGEVSLSRTLAE